MKNDFGYDNFETSQKVPRVGGPLRLTGRGGPPEPLKLVNAWAHGGGKIMYGPGGAYGRTAEPQWSLVLRATHEEPSTSTATQWRAEVEGSKRG